MVFLSTHTPFSAEISHFVVTHKTGEGIMAYHNKGRPTKEQVKIRLHCPDILETEINELRNKLRLSLDKKLLMLVSIATDDMIRMVTMHPEVWFMDVTGGTNRQNRDLFMMATRWPTGETFPGNLTVIPSGKRWIFHCIYQHAFLALYGKVTCSRNRISLCDEDDAEYGPFENCIATVKEFAKTCLMLCLFHAIWQPFKKEIFPHLPKKGEKLTRTGKIWGTSRCYAIIELVNPFLSMHTSDHIIFFHGLGYFLCIDISYV